MSVITSMLQQLQINNSIFLMLGIFLLSFFLVSQISVKKLSAYLVERDHRLDGRDHEIADMKEEISVDRQKIETALREAQIEASRAFGALKMKAAEEQRKILTQAREKSAGEIKEVRENIAQQMSAEMQKVESQIPKLAKLALDQILGASPKGRKEINILGSEV